MFCSSEYRSMKNPTLNMVVIKKIFTDNCFALGFSSIKLVQGTGTQWMKYSVFAKERENIHDIIIELADQIY